MSYTTPLLLESDDANGRPPYYTEYDKAAYNHLPPDYAQLTDGAASAVPNRDSAGICTLRHNTIHTPQFRAHEPLPDKRPYHYKTNFKSASISQLVTPRQKKTRRAHLIAPGSEARSVAKCFNYREFEDCRATEAATSTSWKSGHTGDLLRTSYNASVADPTAVISTSASGFPKLAQNPVMHSSSVFDKRQGIKERHLITGCTKGCYDQRQRFSDVIAPRELPVKKKDPALSKTKSHLEGSIMGLLPSDDESCRDLSKELGRKRFNISNTSSLSSALVPMKQELDQFLVGRPTRSTSTISRKAADKATAGLDRGLCRIPSDEHLMDAAYRAGISKFGKRHYEVPWNRYNFTLHDANPNYASSVAEE